MSEALLVINAGSSSIRCAVYARGSLEPLVRGHVEAIGSAQQRVTWSGPKADACDNDAPADAGHEGVIAWLLQTLADGLPAIRVTAVGHRVVHGGRRFSGPVRIDAGVSAEIERLAPLAPSHQPHNLAAIRAVARTWNGVPQVACFDTAFHHDQPLLARLLPLPAALRDEGIQRYGFHGLSYSYLADRLPAHVGARADGRVIMAHLGHGASLCALRNRRSVATTMGFSTLDGLMMGRRCGRLDPGVLLYLLQTGGYEPGRLADLLYGKCGLLGVSGLSDDVRTLEASADPRAREALDLFAYRAAQEIGALAAVLGGLDVLVFSGGIGENSVRVRADLCKRSAWLGIEIDAAANASGGATISSAKSAVAVCVIPTDEELVIARATDALVDD
jgi:acetate kinase